MLQPGLWIRFELKQIPTLEKKLDSGPIPKITESESEFFDNENKLSIKSEKLDKLGMQDMNIKEHKRRNNA